MANGTVDCGKSSCDYQVSGEDASCNPGGGTCSEAECLEADPSGFHDQHLIDATQKIRQILAGVPADPQGRKLSFLHTRMGTFLAWVRHGEPAGTGGVTAKDPDEKIAKALKLKKRAAAGTGKP